MHEAAPHLDGEYAAFGKIIEGMDVVNRIAETATDYRDMPLEPQRMKKVTVEPLVWNIRNRRSAEHNIYSLLFRAWQRPDLPKTMTKNGPLPFG